MGLDAPLYDPRRIARKSQLVGILERLGKFAGIADAIQFIHQSLNAERGKMLHQGNQMLGGAIPNA